LRPGVLRKPQMPGPASDCRLQSSDSFAAHVQSGIRVCTSAEIPPSPFTSRVLRLTSRVLPECLGAAAVAFLSQPGSTECSDAQTKLHWYGNCGRDLLQHHHGCSCVRLLGQLRLPFLRILCTSCLQLRALPMGLSLVLSTRVLRRFLLSPPRVGVALVGWAALGLAWQTLGLARWLGWTPLGLAWWLGRTALGLAGRMGRTPLGTALVG
jgi:hypothetical protein